MLKGLVPLRDIFLFHEIYILFDFTFIQWITIKAIWSDRCPDTKNVGLAFSLEDLVQQCRFASSHIQMITDTARHVLFCCNTLSLHIYIYSLRQTVLIDRGAFFNSQFWNENGQNVKYARFSIPHSYSGMDRTPFHPFCSQGQNEQNVANENPRWRTARWALRIQIRLYRRKDQVTLLDTMKHCF